MKLLFICNQNQNRSKTAEEIFKDRFETRSAGLFNDKPVSEKEISWADLIIVMEDQQRKEIGIRFPKTYLQKHIISLNIPDTYYFMEDSLITILEKNMKELIEPLIE